MNEININEMLNTELEKVSVCIKDLLKSKNRIMQSVMNWVVRSKGKMLRPQMVILCSKFGDEEKDVSELAALVEILHMATLVHDDVIDDAEKRRGLLSVQKKFGKNMAVYSGDFMLFSSLGKIGERLSNDEVRIYYSKFYPLMEQICDGELGQNAMLYNINITENKYLSNIKGKTAAMFEFACGLGAAAAKCSENVEKNLSEFGLNYGILFQIMDDLLDYKSSVGIIGKPVYQDFENGIYTLPVIYALENASCRKEIIKIKKAVKKNGFTSELTDRLTEAIVKADGFKRCFERAENFYNNARNALAELPCTAERKYMEALLDKLYSDIQG